MAKAQINLDAVGGGGSKSASGQVSTTGLTAGVVDNLGFTPKVVEIYVTSGASIYTAIYDAVADDSKYYNSQKLDYLTLPQTSSGASFCVIGEITSDGFTVLGYASGVNLTYDWYAHE